MNKAAAVLQKYTQVERCAPPILFVININRALTPW